MKKEGARTAQKRNGWRQKRLSQNAAYMQNMIQSLRIESPILYTAGYFAAAPEREKTCQENPERRPFLLLAGLLCMLLLLRFHPMQYQASSIHDKHIPPGDYFRIRDHHISKEWF